MAERLIAPGRVAAALSPAMLIQREAETATARLETARLPTASLGGDTRLVLFRYPEGSLAARLPVTPSGGQRLALDLAVPAPLRHASRLLSVARAWTGKHWLDLEPTMGPVRQAGVAAAVAFEAALPPQASEAAGPLELTAKAFEPADGGRTTVRTEPVDVPAHATLDLAMGILAAARGQGAVRFSISACAGDDCRPVFSQVVDDRGEGADAWRDAAVDLAALGGSRVAFVFETALVAAEAGRGSLPVWANPTLFVPAAGRRRHPNVVLVSIDTLRADHLGAYGYGRGTSPFFDRLAAKGTVFEGLIAEAATTDPSHMTMFTSVPAKVHGAKSAMLALAVPAVTLAELMRGAGYLTAAFTEDGPLAHERGFGRGFDVYGENRSPVGISPEGHIALTFGQGRAWLERNRERPFFLFLHTFQVHSPYDPPPAYREYFARERTPWIRLNPDTLRWRDAAERNALSYDREIRYTDDELRALVGWMHDRGLFRDTVLIVLSDHGEQFYEHGQLGHGTLPFEEVLRPPLVAIGPGVARHRRVAAPVAHLDVMPTILELAGLGSPAQAQGRSLVADLAARGAPPPPPAAPRVLFSSSWVLRGDGLEPPADVVRRGTRKLMRFRDAGGVQIRYFDLAADPQEARNLAPARPAEVAELTGLLDQREGELARLREQIAGGATAPAAPAIPLDPEHEQKLRSLGYIQ